jgi:DNA-directed RNA polymerase subunit RPC12/RpoP
VATATPSASLFECPNCGAGYKVVRMESDKIDVEGQIVCRRCGGPLLGREGRYILKYFLVRGRRAQALKLRAQ